MCKNLMGYQPYVNLILGCSILLAVGLACNNSQPPENIPIQNILPTLTPTSLPGAESASETEPQATADQAQTVPVEENTSANLPSEEAPSVDETSTEANQTENEAAQDQTTSQDNEAVEIDEATQNQTASGNGPIIITALDEIQEYVEIQNTSDTPQDLTGWSIFSEKDAQKCNLAGELKAKETLRIWALATNAAQGGYNCGFSREIWDDTELDAAILYNADDVEISRME